MTTNRDSQKKRKIEIFDTTLRDGEQAPGCTLRPEQKVALARNIAALGVDVIEPGFAISSKGEFEAIQQISRELQHVEICGFARAIQADIDAAIAATADAERRRLHLFISSSSIHLDFQLRKSREQVLQIVRDMIGYAKQKVEKIEFSPMDATRTGEAFLCEMIETAIEAGATIINIPDTVGYALPDEYAAMFTRVMQQVRGSDRVSFSAHCHNDLGMAVANSIAAVQAGVSQIEVTVNGIGERAGNCSLEELVMALETRKDTLGMETGIELGRIYETSRAVSRMMNFPIAWNKPIVGRNAFQHESGIHQDGLLKNRNTYEIMNPQALGIPHRMIVLGKHSGRHAIRHRVSEYGIELDDVQLGEVYTAFKQLADQQKLVYDHQLLRLVGEAVHETLEPVELLSVQVLSGNAGHRMAAVAIKDNRTGEVKQFTGSGEGPIEAAVAGLKQAFPIKIEFDDMELYSLSSGEKAEGEAVVTVSAAGRSFTGTAIHRDIIVAAAHAYMAAANQAMRETGQQLSVAAIENGELEITIP